MRAEDLALIQAACKVITEHEGMLLAQAAQTMAHGKAVGFVTFATHDLRHAFQRALEALDTIAVTVRMAQGGGQPVRSVESQTKAHEEDFRQRGSRVDKPA